MNFVTTDSQKDILSAFWTIFRPIFPKMCIPHLPIIHFETLEAATGYCSAQEFLDQFQVCLLKIASTNTHTVTHIVHRHTPRSALINHPFSTGVFLQD